MDDTLNTLRVVAFVAVFAGSVLFAALINVVCHLRLRRFLKRPCAGLRWRRAFPDAQVAEIRMFLDVLALAFLIRPRHRSRFRPDDRVMDIYATRYIPWLWSVDAMELEDFTSHIEDRYGVNVNEFWRPNITLGDVFRHARMGR